MKKITFVLLFLLSTLFSYSQNFTRVVRESKLYWDGKDWVTENTNYPKELFIVFNDWEIKVGNYKFRTYDTPEKTVYDTHIVYTWKCINGNGDKCTFMMKKFAPSVSEHMIYMIIYDTGVMYEYEGTDK